MLPRKYYLDSIFDNFMEDNTVDTMKCDIYEKDNAYHIMADIPGIDKKDIQVECNNGYLTITATKEDEKEEDGKRFIRKERFYGKVCRKFYVGDVEEDEIKAEFKDGTLSITVPKEDKEKNKKVIDIQ